MHETIDERFEGMRYRIYRPTAAERLPAVIFFHGGGWTLMDIDTHDSIARLIAAASGGAVLSLDYPLAPEAPYPAAAEPVRVSSASSPAKPTDCGWRRARRPLPATRPAPISRWAWPCGSATLARSGRARLASSMAPTTCRRSGAIHTGASATAACRCRPNG